MQKTKMTSDQERILAAEMLIKALYRFMVGQADVETVETALRAYRVCYPKPYITNFSEEECVGAYENFTKRVQFMEMQNATSTN